MATSDANGDVHEPKDGRTLGPSSLLLFFSHLVVLALGASGGYVASNAVLVPRFAGASADLQDRLDRSVAEASALRRDAEDAERRCRAEAADELSELRGKLEARSLVVEKHGTAMADATRAKSELERVRKELEGANERERKVSGEAAESMAKMREAKKELHEARGQHRAEVSDLNSKVFDARRRENEVRAKHEAELAGVREELDRARSEVSISAECKQEVADLRGQIASLVEDVGRKEESHDQLTQALKDELVALGEKSGQRIGDLESKLFDSNELRRRQRKEFEKFTEEAENVKRELQLMRTQPGECEEFKNEAENVKRKLQTCERFRESLEKKLRKDQEAQAGYMEDYSRVAIELKQVKADLEVARSRCGDEVKEEL